MKSPGWQAIFKSNAFKLCSGSDEQIRGARTGRVPEELWMKVHSIVYEAVTKTIPKKKKYKKTNWLSEEVLQIAEEKREMKGKGKRERYTQLNVEFQKISGEKRKPS